MHADSPNQGKYKITRYILLSINILFVTKYIVCVYPLFGRASVRLRLLQRSPTKYFSGEVVFKVKS